MRKLLSLVVMCALPLMASAQTRPTVTQQNNNNRPTRPATVQPAQNNQQNQRPTVNSQPQLQNGAPTNQQQPSNPRIQGAVQPAQPKKNK